ncbi:MAG: hypothetical protein HXS53_00470 [Theionarchaea archaeon]|nr:hypothetical protein [Theionarchaea archaeon]
MKAKWIPVLILTGLLMATTVSCQPKTYSVNIIQVRQIDSRPPVSSSLFKDGNIYRTFSGAPMEIEFSANGFHCGNQDISFNVSYMYRKVRADNFLEDPSRFVMEGYMTSTTIVSDTCYGTWISPMLRDGIHTVGIMAFDGAGAQSPWFYITVTKNNERDSNIAMFPGGDKTPAIGTEEATMSTAPVLIFDTPGQRFKLHSDPVQYVDIYFHTNFPFSIEYFVVEWTFKSQSDCKFSNKTVVYPHEFNKGKFRLDMSSVFASQWERPQYTNGKCEFGQGEFIVTVYCKTSRGQGPPNSITIKLE